MPDLSASWEIPNAFALTSGDFGHDLDGYRAALGFLSDLAGGTPEDQALEINGGTVPMLRSWQASEKFRRVHDKCRRAGVAEREAQEKREASEQERPTTEGGQGFIPLEDMPVVRGVFSSVGNWGEV